MKIIIDSVAKDVLKRDKAIKSYDLQGTIFKISYILFFLVIPILIALILIPILIGTNNRIKKLNKKIILTLVVKEKKYSLLDIYEYVPQNKVYPLLKELFKKELKEFSWSNDLSFILKKNETKDVWDINFLETMYMENLRNVFTQPIGRINKMLYSGDRLRNFTLLETYLGKLIFALSMKNASLGAKEIHDHIKHLHEAVVDSPFYKPSLKKIENTLKTIHHLR
jgi:hypothetical protein